VNRTLSDRYRGGIGMMSWLLHRVSGLVLSAYLLLHIWDLRAIRRGPEAFDQAMAVFQTPFWRFMDLLLLLAVLFHSLNGIRLLLFDAGKGLRQQRQLFWLAFGLTIAIFMYSAIMVFSHLPPVAAGR
jgi:succinate dehydrogenase / fumarate reductase, cytochrome b subunit